jgi:PAS domain S-box-containing protein
MSLNPQWRSSSDSEADVVEAMASPQVLSSWLENLTDHLNTGGNPMNDESEIKQALMRELTSLRERVSELEEELRESEGKYQNILENIEDCYFEVDRAGDFTFFNPSLCRILGYSREEMIGTNYQVLMDAENAKKVLRVFNEVYVTGIPAKGFEWEVIRKDGAKMYIEVLISLIVRPGEKPTRFRGIAHDITERKRIGRT